MLLRIERMRARLLEPPAFRRLAADNPFRRFLIDPAESRQTAQPGWRPTPAGARCEPARREHGWVLPDRSMLPLLLVARQGLMCAWPTLARRSLTMGAGSRVSRFRLLLQQCPVPVELQRMHRISRGQCFR